MNTCDYRVLLVDDERIIRDGISAMVDWKKVGCKYVGDAKDGEEALKKIDKMQPDIIITDIRMPKMNGLELIKNTREKYGNSIEFVVLSGHDSFEFARTAMNHGVKHYILKPCDELDIQGILDKVKSQLNETRNKDHLLRKIQGRISYSKRIFYSDEIITMANNNENQPKERKEDKVSINFENIVLAAKAGNKEYLKRELQSFFSILAQNQYEIANTLSYCADLIITLVREASAVPMDINELLSPIFEMKFLIEISLYVENIALKITNQNSKKEVSHYTLIVQKMLQITENNLYHRDLSIRWIADNYLFMSADYLGKLFRKELNEGFTQYVAKARIDLAKQLIIENCEYKVYQVAEAIGFGDNPQYFYHVFKKYTGFTPLEFKAIFQKQ